jgi:hypothetical protein
MNERNQATLGLGACLRIHELRLGSTMHLSFLSFNTMHLPTEQ